MGRSPRATSGANAPGPRYEESKEFRDLRIHGFLPDSSSRPVRRGRAIEGFGLQAIRDLDARIRAAAKADVGEVKMAMRESMPDRFMSSIAAQPERHGTDPSFVESRPAEFALRVISKSLTRASISSPPIVSRSTSKSAICLKSAVRGRSVATTEA